MTNLINQLKTTIGGVLEGFNTDRDNQEARITMLCRKIGTLEDTIHDMMRLDEQLEADIKELKGTMKTYGDTTCDILTFERGSDLDTLADRIQALEDKKKHKKFCGNCGQTTCKCIEDAEAEAYIGHTIAKHLGHSEEEADGS